MGVRLTEYPFGIEYLLTESAVGVYTEVEIAVPIAPVVTRAGKQVEANLQAIEIMRNHFRLDAPTLEDDQNNSSNVHFSDRTKDDVEGLGDPDIFDTERLIVQNSFTTSGSSNRQGSDIYNHPLTDGDGNGILYTKRSFFVGIVGSGNPTVRAVTGKLWCHLVQVSASEVIINRSLDD